MTEPIPLSNVECERAFLGSLFFLNGNSLKSAMKDARVEWFFVPIHRKVVVEASKLVAKSGTLDAVMLKGALAASGAMCAEEAHGFIIALASDQFTGSNWKLYLDEVREFWTRREVQALGSRLHELAHDPDADPQGEVRAVLRAALLCPGTALADLAEIDADGDERGVGTGFGSLDRFTGFGFVATQVSVVAAYHKGGKTAFMLQCAKAALDAGRSVVYATFADLSPVQLKRRLLKQSSGWTTRPLFKVSEQGAFDSAKAEIDDKFGDGSFKVYDASKHGRTVEDLASKLLSHSLDNKIDAVFVDYAQKVRSRAKGAKDSKTSEMEYVSDELKGLSEDLDCSVIVGSQITRGERKGEQTTKYARAFEEDAGTVFNIGARDENDALEIWVPYNRFGPEGKVAFKWNPHLVKFEELS